jgi:hypothetical protein
VHLALRDAGAMIRGHGDAHCAPNPQELASQTARIDDVVSRATAEDDTSSDIIDSFRAELA